MTQEWFRRFWWLGFGVVATLLLRAIIDGVRLAQAIWKLGW